MTTNALLTCGAIAGPLFVIAFVVEGATRANYNALRHPVSSLALGDTGWIQVANFIVAGLLTLAFAFGLRRVLQQLGGSRWKPGTDCRLGCGSDRRRDLPQRPRERLSSRNPRSDPDPEPQYRWRPPRSTLGRWFCGR